MTSKEEMFYGNLGNQIIARACRDYADAYLGRTIKYEHCCRDYGDKKLRKLLDAEEKKAGVKLQQGSPEHTKFEVEYFFNSDWFRDLTGNKVDPDRLLKETVINAIDDVLAVLEKAFSFKNHSSLTLKIETPKGEDNVSYPLHPPHSRRID